MDTKKLVDQLFEHPDVWKLLAETYYKNEYLLHDEFPGLQITDLTFPLLFILTIIGIPTITYTLLALKYCVCE